MIPIDRVVEAYVKTRDEIKALEKELEEKLKGCARSTGKIFIPATCGDESTEYQDRIRNGLSNKKRICYSIRLGKSNRLDTK